MNFFFLNAGSPVQGRADTASYLDCLFVCAYLHSYILYYLVWAELIPHHTQPLQGGQVLKQIITLLWIAKCKKIKRTIV